MKKHVEAARMGVTRCMVKPNMMRATMVLVVLALLPVISTALNATGTSSVFQNAYMVEVTENVVVFRFSIDQTASLTAAGDPSTGSNEYITLPVSDEAQLTVFSSIGVRFDPYGVLPTLPSSMSAVPSSSPAPSPIPEPTAVVSVPINASSGTVPEVPTAVASTPSAGVLSPEGPAIPMASSVQVPNGTAMGSESGVITANGIPMGMPITQGLSPASSVAVTVAGPPVTSVGQVPPTTTTPPQQAAVPSHPVGQYSFPPATSASSASVQQQQPLAAPSSNGRRRRRLLQTFSPTVTSTMGSVGAQQAQPLAPAVVQQALAPQPTLYFNFFFPNAMLDSIKCNTTQTNSPYDALGSKQCPYSNNQNGDFYDIPRSAYLPAGFSRPDLQSATSYQGLCWSEVPQNTLGATTRDGLPLPRFYYITYAKKVVGMGLAIQQRLLSTVLDLRAALKMETSVPIPMIPSVSGPYPTLYAFTFNNLFNQPNVPVTLAYGVAQLPAFAFAVAFTRPLEM